MSEVLDRHQLFLLLDECRDAIQPITQAQARLHGINLTLARRIDAAIAAENARLAEEPVVVLEPCADCQGSGWMDSGSCPACSGCGGVVTALASKRETPQEGQ